MQLRRKKGISSIIGSIFLILIAFLVLSIFVLIFNTYNQYAKTLLAANNQDVNRMETSIQIKRMIFGSTSQQIASQTFQSQKNTANLPFYPIQNMNFSQNMNGWFFTRTYKLFSGTSGIPGGAVGGYDPATPVASESGPGSIYVFFEPTISGQPINQNQQLGATMNFTTSFTLDSTTSQSISSAGFSFGYSLDTFNCQGKDACNLNTTVYLIQEATGKSFKLYTVLFPKNPTSTGFVFVTRIPISNVNWASGKYDVVISTIVTLSAHDINYQGEGNCPAEMQMHFDDVGIALKLVSSSYFVDTWSNGQFFVINTNQKPLNITSINIDITLGTNSGPVYAYAYLNDFSRGTQQSPFWTLQNSTVFTSSTDLQINIPSFQVRLYVNSQGQILLRVFAVSLSQFTLSVTLTSTVSTNDHSHASLLIANNSPFAVHLVSLYVNSPTGLVHLDTNSSALGVSGTFDYWLAPGQLLTVTVPVQWQSGQVYTVVITTSTGVVVASSFTS